MFFSYAKVSSKSDSESLLLVGLLIRYFQSKFVSKTRKYLLERKSILTKIEIGSAGGSDVVVFLHLQNLLDAMLYGNVDIYNRVEGQIFSGEAGR